MATIINNPNNPGTERVVEREADSGGWAVAVVVLIAVIAGLLWWFYYRPAPASTQPSQNESSGSTNINVSLPGIPGTGDTGTSTGQ